MKTACRLALFTISLLLMSGCSWTKIVSVDSAGDQGNNTSRLPSVSGDGRYVAFQSDASNLVAGDTNSRTDIFVHDTVNGATTRVSVDSAGAEANNHSYEPSISDDGRYVAFTSFASNLVADDTNSDADIFVHDTVSDSTFRVSVDSAGAEGSGGSSEPSISGDGRYISFLSGASNLVAGDTNGVRDVFVHDTINGATTRVSVDSSGAQGNNLSLSSAISEDGRYVAFRSIASNLVTGDTNGEYDIFVHDTISGTTTRVSVDSTGTEGNRDSTDPSISGDGRYVAFRSFASNLVAGDNNGQLDIFVHDTVSGTTSRVSVSSAGMEGNNGSALTAISEDGRYVAFVSSASTLVEDDLNSLTDIFVHDRGTGITSRVSLDSQGMESMGGASFFPSISADGRYVAFETDATNLVDNDTNGARDIVIRSIPNVTVTSITPDILPIGDTTSVTVTGTYFLSDADLIIGGTGKSISDVVIVDENTITANITVDPGASTGARGVAVSLPGTGPGSLRGVVGNCAGCLTFGDASLFCPTAVLDDGIACTVDSCDESTDTVLHTPDNSLCDDLNACTIDSCSNFAGCVFVNAPAGTPCDDGDENTTGDSCNLGACVGNPL